MSKPKIAVLDDYANFAPQFLSQFSDRIDISYFPDTLNPAVPADLDALVQRLSPFPIISTMRERTPFRKPLLERLPNLKVLLTTGMRNLGVDTKTCKELGIVVVGTRGANKVPNFDTTNEQTWALILGLAKGIAEHDALVKSEPSRWQASVSVRLAGKTLACLGLGRLGLQCARTAALGFGMKVVAWSPNLTQEKAGEGAVSVGLAAGSVQVASSKEELFREADVLSVHLVLSDRSRGSVGAEELSWMKKSAMLVNTSRGPLVDEHALLDALRKGQIRGFAADVFDTEPLPVDSEWRNSQWGQDGRSHVLISPHMGYVEEQNLTGMYKETVENIWQWLDGEEFKNKMV
ncbi:hypothetical protein PMIN06_001211 [Paraphaeosphaeria minitans]|uniref:D-isomer specific 2-hydroxyacid dehydrogenase n=1 Tax=Paraphaeosphaeria minitans TaxID=565426 RepID=A0A9P6GL31_9PLEO|nr:D-isomer specific 2-hydroxyacid dehydrogenase [Paraphaeosphaeria minitans]